MNVNAKLILFISILSMTIFSLESRAEDDVINKVTAALKTSDANKLSVFFYSTINLEVSDIDGSYSKKQAEIILNDFFKKEPAKSFEIKHQGSSDDGSKYLIGNYKTTSKEYRVYILFKKQDDNLLIHQLQFEED